MEIIKLKDEFIKLGQALKAANLVEDGVEAKYVIQDEAANFTMGIWWLTTVRRLK